MRSTSYIISYLFSQIVHASLYNEARLPSSQVLDYPPPVHSRDPLVHLPPASADSGPYVIGPGRINAFARSSALLPPPLVPMTLISEPQPAHLDGLPEEDSNLYKAQHQGFGLKDEGITKMTPEAVVVEESETLAAAELITEAQKNPLPPIPIITQVFSSSVETTAQPQVTGTTIALETTPINVTALTPQGHYSSELNTLVDLPSLESDHETVLAETETAGRNRLVDGSPLNSDLKSQGLITATSHILERLPSPHTFVELAVGGNETTTAGDEHLRHHYLNYYASCLIKQGNPSESCFESDKITECIKHDDRGCHMPAGYLWGCFIRYAENCPNFDANIWAKDCRRTVEHFVMCLTGTQDQSTSMHLLAHSVCD